MRARLEQRILCEGEVSGKGGWGGAFTVNFHVPKSVMLPTCSGQYWREGGLDVGGGGGGEGRRFMLAEESDEADDSKAARNTPALRVFRRPIAPTRLARRCLLRS
jgi:hypothetical protein